jgi:hypothetical protein
MGSLFLLNRAAAAINHGAGPVEVELFAAPFHTQLGEVPSA